MQRSVNCKCVREFNLNGFFPNKRERELKFDSKKSAFSFSSENKQMLLLIFSNFTRSSPQFEMRSVELQQTDSIGLGYTFLLPMFGTSKLENDSLQSLDSNGKRIWSLPCSPTWQTVERFKKAINSPKFVCSGFQQLKDPPFESSHPSSPIQWKLFIQSHQIKNQKIKQERVVLAQLSEQLLPTSRSLRFKSSHRQLIGKNVYVQLTSKKMKRKKMRLAAAHLNNQRMAPDVGTKGWKWSLKPRSQ